MRIYVVVTSYDPLRVYLNDEGLVRFATEPFSTNLDSLRCRTMHLTNYSVNKLSSAYVHNFDGRPDSAGNMPCADAAQAVEKDDQLEGLDGSDDDGDDGGGGGKGPAGPSKWSLNELREFFAKEGWDWSVCKERMIDLIIKTLIAVEPIIVSSWHRGMGVSHDPKGQKGSRPSQSCFEVYGFDILLDQELKPWLLEVNVSPSLSSSSPLDKRIKTQLVADTLTLLGLSPKPLGPDANRQPRDKGFGSPSRSSITSSNEQLGNIGESGWHTILDTQDEGMRTGALERIFPLEQNVERYNKFFVVQRQSNQVLLKWLTSGGSSIFRSNSGVRLPKWIPKQISFDRA
jgi:tubulin polyglutamylase TTLL4